MAKQLTRREFLKYGGQAIAFSGAACAVAGLGSPRAQAATETQLDGREIVGKVGDTFATIQLVPGFSKTSTPQTILAKVQYGTDPAFATYAESAEVTADYLVWKHAGKHVGLDGSSELTARFGTDFIKWNWEIEPGDFIYNKTDGSAMVVSEVLSNRKVAGTLFGGLRNCWNKGDRWKIYRTYYKLELKLAGLAPSTRYYYRVLLRYEGEPWPAPRPTHSFRTRRAAGETFRFAIWADSHRSTRSRRDRRYWPEWDTLVGNLQGEQVDFLIDLGDTWLLTRGYSKPLSKHFHPLYATAMRPARNGWSGYRGVSDLCADCGYYVARGNHGGINDLDRPKRTKLLASLFKLFVPNPNGSTYPQGGSTDSNYDQGYFAFEWGDALFVVMDVVKYKERTALNDTPARFHIGGAQLAWVTSVLQNSSQPWKFVFMHHLFGGGNNYGRGGAAFAFDYEQAQLQALAEQYGAHFFYGHDHLLATGFANGVLYHCCGCAWGAQANYLTRQLGTDIQTLYPDGYTSTSCKSDPPACENNGYVVVEVSPGGAKIQYKGYQGNVLSEIIL